MKDIGGIAFLIGVMMLWYWQGSKIDHRRHPFQLTKFEAYFVYLPTAMFVVGGVLYVGYRLIHYFYIKFL